MEMLFSNKKRFWHKTTGEMQGGFFKKGKMIIFQFTL